MENGKRDALIDSRSLTLTVWVSVQKNTVAYFIAPDPTSIAQFARMAVQRLQFQTFTRTTHWKAGCGLSSKALARAHTFARGGLQNSVEALKWGSGTTRPPNFIRSAASYSTPKATAHLLTQKTVSNRRSMKGDHVRCSYCAVHGPKPSHDRLLTDFCRTILTFF